MNFPLLNPEELKSELQRSGRRGLALDIDETLAQSNRHWLDFILDRLGPPAGITRDEILSEYWNNIENVPHWPREKIMEIAEEIFHSNDFQMSMPLIENANHAVNDIHNIRPIAAYITARPVSVASGTRHWLERHGFPKAPLVMKPLQAEFSLNNWKAGVLKFLYPEILGIIDDNLGLVRELSPDYAGTVFIYASPDHPTAGANRIPCADWDSVKIAVKEFASRSAIL